MKRYVLKTGSGNTLAFDGRLVAISSSHIPDASRWSDVHVYSAEGGRLVVERIDRTTMPGERHYTDVWVAKTPAEVRAWLGDCSLADDIDTQLEWLLTT